MRWWVLVVVLACGSKESSHEIESKPERTEVRPKSALELFEGPKVAIPRALKVALGMPVSAMPEGREPSSELPLPGYDGVMDTTFRGGALQRIDLTFPEPLDVAKAALSKKWGPPRVGKDNVDRPIYVFQDPDTGLRAVLEREESGSRVRFVATLALTALLGSVPKRFGFETKPLIGMTRDDVIFTFPTTAATGPGLMSVYLPPLATSDRDNTIVHINVDKGGKVIGFLFRTPKDPAVSARLEQLFGKGETPPGGDRDLVFRGPPKVRLSWRESSEFEVVVGDIK